MSRRPALAITAAMMTFVSVVPSAYAGTTWSTYHGDNARSGVDSTEPSFNPIAADWSSRLDGQAVFGQPVVAGGRVFVATEGDDVYALDEHSGKVLWSANIGTPLSNVPRNTGCGDIDPLGITSTPVIDTATETLFAVGEVSSGGGLPVHHIMVGFNLSTGRRTVTASADPAGGRDSLQNLQQRAALAVGGGRVYIAYGGLDGDCGHYHGWVIGLDETNSRPMVEFDVTPNSTGGAIWSAGAGPSIDSAGNVYVVTGNPNSGSYENPAYADSVVKLNSSLQPLAFFHDPLANAGSDQDLGTGDALLLPNGDVFTAGKTNVGYLLRQSDLKLVHSISGVCTSDPDGGASYDAGTNSIYVPCAGGGIQQVDLNTGTAGWERGSVNGSPILVDGHLWAVRWSSGLIQELDPATGGVQQQISGATVPHFATPSAADGLLLIGTNAGIEAFGPPTCTSPPAPAARTETAGYRLIASDGGVFSYGNALYYGSLGCVHLNQPIVGAARTADDHGYWLVASDGGVFTFGDAHFFGSTGALHLNAPVVGMAPTSDGHGYWLVARDGGIFAFGDARFHGSMGGRPLNAPIVSIAADRSSSGYWMFGADGGVFDFGGARFFGSAGDLHLIRPVVGATSAPDGRGYWMVAGDGGLFNYGPGAYFHGSMGGRHLNKPIVAMAADTATGGYWEVGSDGGVFNFDAPFYGSTGAITLNKPIVAMTGT
jgi:polyvinyl alcohol dehydrogenase (cytochrome)